MTAQLRQVGYFARAHEDGHDARWTKTHFLVDGKPICGYKPHPTMLLYPCAYEWDTMRPECKKCAQRLGYES